MTVQGARVLVVDDNAMNRKLISMVLQRMGCIVEEADCGADCLAMQKQTEYDLILMDHMMPEMDGVETLLQLKKQENAANQEVPVIALTADDGGNGEEYYIQLGFDGYLVKPVLPKSLMELIENL